MILAHPLIAPGGKLTPRLVLIALDAEMQLDSVEVIADDFAGSLAPYHDAVLTALDREYTRYFAIAHPGSVRLRPERPRVRNVRGVTAL